MKVFFVNSSKTWGGGEKWHFEMACALMDAGYDVSILAQFRKELFMRSMAAGLRTIPVFITHLTFINPFRMMSLTALFRKEKPDIVILNFSSDIKAAGTSAKFAGIKNIIYRRGSAIPIRNTFLNRWLYKNVITQIIANSEETKRTILQYNPTLVPSFKIEVIYNGLRLDQFDNLPVYEVYPRKNEEILIGNAGRLVLQKGQKYLIEMAEALKLKNINFKILIAGDGPLESSLKQMAANAGVEDSIVFLGFISNIKAFMDNIDIFVLPSIWEGFGYVLIEAMACKKPVAAFNVSSNPEIIADNITGFLLDNNDVAGMTRKVELLIQRPDLRESMGIAGRQRVKEIFEIHNTQKQIEGLFRRIHYNINENE